MKIGLITYNRAHKKTYDLACMLKMNGYQVVLLMVPFEERKARTPLIKHRSEGYCADPGLIAAEFNWELDTYGKVECDKYIIGGCNIMPGLKALNSHPGYLPYIRGLDALKWAIYHGVPIGVTVHETTDEPDKGPMYSRELVPLYFEDTFHSLAERAYQYEIAMLVDAIELDKPSVFETKTPLSNTVHKRMPQHIERIMLQRFEDLRKSQKSMYD